MKIRPNILVTFIWLLTSCHNDLNNAHLAKILRLPEFKILASDGETFMTPSQLSFGRYIILIYFDPNCEHCQFETEQLLHYKRELSLTSIYMISNDTIKNILLFSKKFGLDTLPNFFVGKDYNYSFFSTYLPQTVPFIAIYDRQKQLKKIYTGETNVRSLIYSTQ
jgi:hypothetical protein